MRPQVIIIWVILASLSFVIGCSSDSVETNDTGKNSIEITKVVQLETEKNLVDALTQSIESNDTITLKKLFNGKLLDRKGEDIEQFELLVNLMNSDLEYLEYDREILHEEIDNSEVVMIHVYFRQNETFYCIGSSVFKDKENNYQFFYFDLKNYNDICLQVIETSGSTEYPVCKKYYELKEKYAQ